MNTITSTLTVGKERQGLDLYCNIAMDGQRLQRFRSRSFLGAFAWTLQSLMHQGRDMKLGHTGYYSSYADGRSNIIDHYNYYRITATNSGSPLAITVDRSSLLSGFRDKDDPYSNYIYICDAPALNGIYRGVKTGTTSVELYHLDGTPVDGTVDSPLGGLCVPTVGYVDYSVQQSNSDGNFMGNAFQSWQIILGRANNPVNVEDVYLWDRIMPGTEDGKLTHGNLNIGPQTTDKPSSKFVLSKTFTNQGAADITVYELGILAQLANGSSPNNGYNNGTGQGYLMVRDTLDSPLSIPSGKTLTVDYELVVRLSPDTQDTNAEGTNGGFLEPFMRRVRTIAYSMNSGRGDYFSLASGVGKTSVNGASNYDSSAYGIRLGDDNQFVSMTDTGLNVTDTSRNGFSHGSDAGQLYHYGNDVGPVTYDLLANKAQFTISRIFENRSGQPVVVKEIGLFGNTEIGGTSGVSSWTPEILARTALAPADQFTIQPGEYKKVEYIIEVIA